MGPLYAEFFGAKDANKIRVEVEMLEPKLTRLDGVDPAAAGWPAYHPSIDLELYIYGYLNRVQSSRRLEREAGRNDEVMWLIVRLAPDHKTIAGFREDNGPAIDKVCARFAELCRRMDLVSQARVAIDAEKFEANNHHKIFTSAKVERRRKE